MSDKKSIWHMFTAAFSVFFLLAGVLWLVCIYKRSITVMPAKSVPYVQSNKSVIDEIKQLPADLKEIVARDSVVVQEKKVVITQELLLFFWTIIIVEVGAAFSYIVASIALWRGYPIARLLTILCLFLDMSVKALVHAFYTRAATPLAKIFDVPNMVETYFQPDATIFSSVSGVYTGLHFLQGQTAWGVYVYGACLLVAFYVFTREEIIEKYK